MSVVPSLSRRRPGCWALALALLALGAAMPADAAGPARVAGLIVKLRDVPSVGEAGPWARSKRLQRMLNDADIAGTRVRGVGRASQRVDFGRLLDADEAQALAGRLRALPQVEWVVPNEREQRLAVPQDPLYAATALSSGQWWLFPHGGTDANDIEDRRRGVPDLPSAWNETTGSPTAVVAVLDTGITAHPDLVGRVLPGRDFVSTVEYANDGDGWDDDPSDPGDWVSTDDQSRDPALFGDCTVDASSWHGTIISGQLVAAANNSLGGAGISWNGHVLPVRVAGKCGAEVADIIVGMRWAAGLQVYDDHGLPVPLNPTPARVINISFGGSAPCNVAYRETIDELWAAGAIVVASAGNTSGAVSRPANCKGVVGVAALNRDGFKSSYSSFGPEVAIATVGGDPRFLGAWGMDVGDDGLLTLSNFGTQSPGQTGYVRVAGTSFAAPLVAGVAALMLSVEPSLSAKQLVEGLEASARPHVRSPVIGECSDQNPGRCLCTTSTCGAGILDATQAVLYARDPVAYVAPAAPAESLDNPELRSAAALGLDMPANASPSGGNLATGSGGGAGGGALGLRWLLALALALAALRRRARRA